MTPWPTPEKIVASAPMLSLCARWEALARQHGPVRLLGPAAGVVVGERVVGVAPALRDVVAALPGVALGAIAIDWPQGESQQWPELGSRETYQPVWVDGREAVVVRIDPTTGAAREVLHLRGDGDVEVVGDDVVSWWTALTSWAESELARLVRELAPEAASDEEEELLLEEALDQDFTVWLRELPRDRPAP